MKLPSSKHAMALAILAATMATPAARAANTFYTPGDLVLYFQQEGGTNTVYANLGNAASFRGSAAGAAGGTNQLNFLNLNTTLESAFGLGWASDSTIYAGMAGVFSTNSSNATAVVDGDPYRTLYVSASRTSIGTVGQASSAGYIVNTNTGMTTGASSINAQNNAFETKYDAMTTVSTTADSLIDDYNPFVQPGLQDTAFQIFGGGVQQAGNAGAFGTFGAAGQVEFALDLYRILARDNVSGQVAGNLREGSYEGTVTVGSNGYVSFVAVPEPSSLTLAGLAAGALFLRRRRA
ncbi:MAG: PEP-CTERM sorting domain-containing protein [Verrucomicrobiota bacterium]